MSDNIQIIARSYLDEDDVVLQNDNAEVLYPVSNLAVDQVTLRWRTTSLVANEQVNADLLNLLPISGFSVNGHNLGYDSSVRLTLYQTLVRGLTVTAATESAGEVTITFAELHQIFDDSTDNAVYIEGVVGMTDLNNKVWDCVWVDAFKVKITLATAQTYTSGGTGISMDEVYDSSQAGLSAQYGWPGNPWGIGGWYGYDVDAGRKNYTNFWFDSLVADYFRVEFNDSANPDGYIEAGRFMLGFALNPKYNMLWGPGLSYRSQSRIQRTRSGSLISDNKPSYRRASFKLDYMSEDEAMVFMSILDDPGQKSDALISMYPAHTGRLGKETTILGRFINYSDLKRSRYGYSINITFEEGN